MKQWVVDASVVAAAFFQEEHAACAGALLAGKHALLAPDLVHAEVANVIWKRCSRQEITPEEAGRLVADLRSLPLAITASSDLIEIALELAIKTGHTVYDCLYLALAMTSNCAMVTADRRLTNALAGSFLSEHIVWLGEKTA